MSTLLEQASLIMIPSGYKEDVVYSVIPENGNGDLSFTRASDGTRVNSAGLVEVVAWNLLQQSNTFNTTWAFSGTGTVTSGATDPFGGTSAWTLAKTTANTFIYQSTSGLLGSVTFSIYAKAGSVDQLHLRHDQTTIFSAYFDLTNGTTAAATNCVASIVAIGGGWFLCSIIGDVLTPNNIRIYPASSGSISGSTGNILIYGAQANQGALKPYFPTTDRLNVPRLTYQNGGGGCPSLLLEKQSTNLTTYSEDFANANWVATDASVTTNAIISPDGTQNADKLNTNTTNNYHRIVANAQATATTAHTMSIFAKKGEYKYIGIAENNNDVGYGVFDLNAGTVLTSGSGATNVTIQNMGNGWYRCQLTFTAGAYSRFDIYAINDSYTSGNPAAYSFVGSSSNGLYIWGAQLEAGSYPTSYIPTTSSSATRVADACFKTGISSLIGQTEGVMFADFVWTKVGKTYQSILLGGTSNYHNTVYLLTTESSGAASYQLYIGGATAIATISTTFTTGTRYKVALAYKSGSIAFYVNGVSVGTSAATYGAVSEAISQFRYDWPYGGDEQWCGPVSQTAIFPTRLTNAELASLTTI